MLPTSRRTFMALPLLVLLAGAPGAARAAAKGQLPWGLPGDARQARRTFRIRMSDDMRFTPDRIRVNEGDTVRFILHNAGKLEHEMAIGTREKLDERMAAMTQIPYTLHPHGPVRARTHAHDEPGMVHVMPGATRQLVWKFNRAGEFTFACLIPGQYEAGMIGTILVLAHAQPRRRH
ncbi:MAG TPA: cupredoxin family protein [Ramlibacter sp.]|uniref:cupredoxin domain-containing protein n=1 Tax=Ramlibacter sp. TaxID=1917967 RepID=UPI002B5A22DD|nr:cupredoxin family protein [Ramlibacter sp.]HVZ46232.1 cupredoxin family protein [Ramlibacter sp.]